jgi:hypothetical protein
VAASKHVNSTPDGIYGRDKYPALYLNFALSCPLVSHLASVIFFDAVPSGVSRL